MTKKGVTYVDVDIDFGKWCKDMLHRHNWTKGELARRLVYPDTNKSLHRARITEIAQGRANTRTVLEIIVHSFYGGRYRELLPYATSPAGERLLKQLDFEKELDPKTWRAWDDTLERTRKRFRLRHLKARKKESP